MSGFEPGSEEVWTIEKTRELLSTIIKFLWDKPKICLLGELRAYIQKEGIADSRTIRYLIDTKYKDNNEVAEYVQDVNEILEFRVSKSNEIAPGIASMLLKNKHGLTDKTEILLPDLDLKGLLGKESE